MRRERLRKHRIDLAKMKEMKMFPVFDSIVESQELNLKMIVLLI